MPNKILALVDWLKQENYSSGLISSQLTFRSFVLGVTDTLMRLFIIWSTAFLPIKKKLMRRAKTVTYESLEIKDSKFSRGDRRFIR